MASFRSAGTSDVRVPVLFDEQYAVAYILTTAAEHGGI